MSVLNIDGVKIKFPYEKPYDLQLDYMKKVLQCLDQKRHGILESPTGTGKTLCLFAPVTSWLQTKRLPFINKSTSLFEEKNPNTPTERTGKQRVWYTARTHSQIAQTVSEVRKCDIEGLQIRVMGARDQLCINPLVMNEKESHIKSVKCKELVKNRSCSYYRNLDRGSNDGPDQVYKPGEVLDIEDLVSQGRSKAVCPYHLARKSKAFADIVLMPYNYIIDRESRVSNEDGIDLRNAVVIFDEGHNVPNTCEEGFEFTLTSVDLALGIRNIKDLMKAIAEIQDKKQKEPDNEAYDEKEPVDFAKHAQSCELLVPILNKFEAQLAEMPVSKNQLPYPDLIDFFKKAGVSAENSDYLIHCLESFREDSVELQLSGPTTSTILLLEKALHILYGKVITSSDVAIVHKSFKFVISEDNQNVQNSKKLSLYCFNPSFGMMDVLNEGASSLILTSGTLSPIRNFIHELGLATPPPVTLENGHIATKSQVPFMILGTGVNNIRMDASFANRTNAEYMYSLGMTLTNLISSIPDGVLLLFSSYSVMKSLKEYWEGACGVWTRLNALKRVFLEPRDKEDFISCMENFRRAIDARNGAVLMGVLRGKISEGMDFKDQYCRGVFIIGVPFPPVMDPRVIGKGKYVETLQVKNPTTNRMEPLYGANSFMTVEAMKATNQAIGRVIRHAADYGAIVLVDYRFARPGLFNSVSRWLRHDAPTEVNFPTAKKTLREFFKNLRDGMLGIREIRMQDVGPNGEPVAKDIQYDVYDHKKANRVVPDPWKLSELGTYNSAGISEDRGSSASRFGLDYDIYTRRSTNPSQFLESTDARKVRPFGQRMFASNHSRGSWSAPNSPSQKRKTDSVPHTLRAPLEKKRMRQQLKSIDANQYEPEPESTSSRPASENTLRNDIILYIQEVRNILSQSEGMIFKESVWKYMKGDSTLHDTFSIIKGLLEALPGYMAHLRGFGKCVLPKDKGLWNDIIGAL